MNKLKNIIKLFLALSLILFTSTTFAETKGIGFEVSPMLPNTQIDPGLGYFYLKTEPGQKQSFDVSVFSTSDEDMELEVIVENAISTNNGNISYSSDLEKIDESLKNPISEIVVPKEKNVTLKKHEESVINFEVNAPETSYNGLKMGRVIIKKKKDESKKGINQEYQYGIGVILSESGDPFNDGDKLELLSVQPTISNGSKAISAEIVNPESKTIENLKVRSYVTKKGSKEKLKERNIDNFSFAPNSKVAYMIPWGLTNFETGEYTFYFTAKNDFESFDLKMDFKIRANDARNLNKEAAFSVGTSRTIILIIIILNILLIFLCCLVIFKNNKWSKQLRDKKKKRNTKRKKIK